MSTEDAGVVLPGLLCSFGPLAVPRTSGGVLHLEKGRRGRLTSSDPGMSRPCGYTWTPATLRCNLLTPQGTERSGIHRKEDRSEEAE